MDRVPLEALRPLTSLDDNAARLEGRRVATVALARWRQNADWLGYPHTQSAPVNDGPSPFENGMLALFRYARGEDVPEVIVASFIDELLTLMFAGLASGALALPGFDKMRDRPWAVAWRAAELRLNASAHEPVSWSQLAHLLGADEPTLRATVGTLGYDSKAEAVSHKALVALLRAASDAPQDLSPSAE